MNDEQIILEKKANARSSAVDAALRADVSEFRAGNVKRTEVAPVTPHADIVSLILSMDKAGNLETGRKKLAGHGDHALPAMVECLPRLRTWRARDTILSAAIKFARTSDIGKKLGFMGMADKSKRVRQTACSLAAFSLDRAFLPTLNALRSAPDSEVAEDAIAAIDAIQHQNHHLFMDRQHTGSVTWNVMGSGVET